MELEKNIDTNWARIPIIVDVKERIIDNHHMVRCSYFSIQSEEPMQNWTLTSDKLNSKIFLLNFESILLGPPSNTAYFSSLNEVDEMYQLEEQHDELFVDINDIWVPIEWFDRENLEQGQLHRISAARFSQCWKFRNDLLSIDELLEEGLPVKQERMKTELEAAGISYSPEETSAFERWTKKEIERSKTIYHDNRERYLTKIKS